MHTEASWDISVKQLLVRRVADQDGRGKRFNHSRSEAPISTGEEARGLKYYYENGLNKSTKQRKNFGSIRSAFTDGVAGEVKIEKS